MEQSVIEQPLPSVASEQVYTVPEVAKLLRIGRTSAYSCVAAGTIPSVRLGRRIRIPGAALKKLLEEGAPASQPPAA